MQQLVQLLTISKYQASHELKAEPLRTIFCGTFYWQPTFAPLWITQQQCGCETSTCSVFSRISLFFFIRKTLALLIVKKLKVDGAWLFAVVPRDNFKRQMESALGVPAWGRAAPIGFQRSPPTPSILWFCIILWKPSYAKKENMLPTPSPTSATQLQCGASTSQLHFRLMKSWGQELLW